MSDTPISDSTPHNVAELGMLCRRLERKQAVNPQYEAHERLCKSIGDMAKENEDLKQRIKRLEEAGDELLYDNDDMANINRWHKAKEAKL